MEEENDSMSKMKEESWIKKQKTLEEKQKIDETRQQIWRKLNILIIDNIQQKQQFTTKTQGPVELSVISGRNSISVNEAHVFLFCVSTFTTSTATSQSSSSSQRSSPVELLTRCNMLFFFSLALVLFWRENNCLRYKINS